MGFTSVHRIRATGATVARPGVVRSQSPGAATPVMKIVNGVMVTSGVALSSPLAAQAAATPSLRNLLYSVLAGGTVLFALFGAVSIVAQFDPVNRK